MTRNTNNKKKAPEKKHNLGTKSKKMAGGLLKGSSNHLSHFESLLRFNFDLTAKFKHRLETLGKAGPIFC